LEKDLEQFTNSPMDTLATMLKERGMEWIINLPTGIGAYKEGEEPGLFILFTDGAELYWRLKHFKNGELVTSPTKIINLVLKGESHNKGENINYGDLIDSMQAMKQELFEELIAARRRRRTLRGAAASPSRIIKEIYDELAKHEPDGEKLALLFRKNSTKQTLVSALVRARKNGVLVEKARELLTRVNSDKEFVEKEKEIELKRVCWCWIHA